MRFDGTVQVSPPSVEMPRRPEGSTLRRRPCRHIFGRGRSWMPLKAPHMSPFTLGSNSIQ